MALALFILSAICFLLAIYPFFIYPLTLYVIRRFHSKPLAPAADYVAERYAICVCAYNEEDAIAQKAENMLQARNIFPDLDIRVYIDASTDRTAEILDAYKDRIHVHVSPERHGKTYGMNLLMSQTDASVIIFTDANVMFDIESLRNLPRYFADPQVGCVCGHLKYINEGETITAMNGSLYWRLEERIKQLESDTGSVMGADGSIFAIRRSLHRPVPDGIVDDMFVSLSILCDGYRVTRAGDVLAYEKTVTSAQEEFRRKVRIACLAFNAHRLLWPRLRHISGLDLYKYVSHKLLRWFVIYWLALSGLFFEMGMIATGTQGLGILLALLCFLILGMGSILKVGPVIQVMDILGAFAGTGLGVLRSLKGERFKTWSPATSIRSK